MKVFCKHFCKMGKMEIDEKFIFSLDLDGMKKRVSNKKNRLSEIKYY